MDLERLAVEAVALLASQRTEDPLADEYLRDSLVERLAESSERPAAECQSAMIWAGLRAIRDRLAALERGRR